MAGRSSPGPAQFLLKKAIKDIKHLKNVTDLVIVSVHWGIEYDDYPVPYQMNMARRLIDAGAVLILGHGPHYVQGIEKYKNGMIIYSLGDFIFDEPFQKSKESFIFKCEFNKQKIISHKIIPTLINDKYQAIIASNAKKDIIFSRVNQLSNHYKEMTPELKKNNLLFLTEIYWKISSGCSMDILKNFHVSLISWRLLLDVLKKIRIKHLIFLLKKISRLFFK